MSLTVSQMRLVSTGLRDLRRAESLLDSTELAQLDDEDLLDQLQVAPDPDQALLLLIRLIERDPAVAQLVADGQARPLLRLLGASEALGEFLIRRSENLDLFHTPKRDLAPACSGLADEHCQLRDASQAISTVLCKTVDADP